MYNGETPPQKARRLVVNTWIRCLGMSKKSQLMFGQKVKEIELKECKKAFGIEYLGLVERDASDEVLQACVDQAKRRMAAISLAIAESKVAIKRAEAETKQKILEDPLHPGSVTNAAVPIKVAEDAEVATNEEYIVVEGPLPSAPPASKA